MSVTCSDSMKRSQRLNIENGYCSPHSSLLKYKRRKVSVIRDFPPGCGRNVLRNNSIPIEGATCNTTENCLSGYHGVSGSMGMLEANTALELTTKESNIYFLKDGHNTVNVESSPLTDNLEVKDGATENIRNRVGVDASLKDLHEVVVSARKEERLDPSTLRPCSPPDYCIFVSNGKDVKKAMIRRYPPRRKISAIRDFPPFCGRNSPPLSKEVCSLVIASQNVCAIDKDNSRLHKSSNLGKDAERVADNVHQAQHNTVSVEDMTKLTMDKICPSMMVKPTKAIEMHDKCGSGNKYIVEKCTKTSQTKSDNKCESRLHEAKEGLEEKLGKEIVAYTGDTTKKEKSLDMPSCWNHLEIEHFEQAFASERVVVQGLMASPNCPWRQGKSNCKPSPGGGSSDRRVKKRDYRLLEKTKSIIRNKDAKEYYKPSSKKKSTTKRDSNDGEMHQPVITGGMDIAVCDKIKKYADSGEMPQLIIAGDMGIGVSHKVKEEVDNGEMRQLVIAGDVDNGVSDTKNHDSNVNFRSYNTDVSLIPFSKINEGGNDRGNDSKGTRTMVRETLRLFQAVCRKLLQEEETGKKVQGNASRRIDCIAAKILKDKGKYVNVGKQILGSVPGVEVGDEFRYRIELNIIGLHRQTQGGIDYVKHGQKILATSVVASGGYTNNLDNSDVLIYTGQGGNVMNSDKKPEDQKLERGNLALKNSFDEKSPVRVIRGSESSEGRTYVYDGLYLVEKWWQDMGPHGKLIFKFQLCRIPGQPELAWKELKKSKKFKVREGLCVEDIAQGKESIRICAVNIIDDEKPPPFNYITKMIYPDWCHPIPLKGCDCTDGCSDSDKCYCAVLNGGEIPFNHNGAIVEAKSLVYECGPSCKCLPSCHNRVSQHGIKFQLEIFKTKSRGWGVRSLNSIPSGSFICEYIGELLEDKEAEQRTGNDEYLFDIGNNYSENSLWDGLSNLLPDAQLNACDIVEDGSFTIDAAHYGNIGRFINHSCSPNLYAQNVLYDHEDKRIPHIMFFAAENIPPLQELSYHYNYMMDQVRDSDGNIKKKRCHCGSTECTGWMY